MYANRDHRRAWWRRVVAVGVGLAAIATSGVAVGWNRPAAADPAAGFELTTVDGGARPSYVVRLRPGVAASVRNDVASVTAEITRISGITFTSAADTNASPSSGEIVIEVSETSACGLSASWVGCALTRASSSNVKISDSSLVTIRPAAVGASYARTVVAHEIGHAVGLAHFSGTYGGATQVMYPAAIGGPTYGAGDANGLRAVARNGSTGWHSPIGSFAVFAWSPYAGAAPQLYAGGWAADRDAGTAPIGVRVTRNGNTVASTVANDDRPDLATTFGDLGTRHGWTIAVPTPPPGVHEWCFYGTNVGVGDDTKPVRCTRVPYAPTKAIGSLGSVKVSAGGTIIASGWAVPAGTLDMVATAKATVTVTVDGAPVVSGPTTIARDDVSPNVPRGYSLTATGISGGTHQVCATVGPTVLACTNVVIGGPPTGGITGASGDARRVIISGYALDPDVAVAPVRVSVDGTVVVTEPADVANTTRAARAGYAGNHAFDIPIAVGAGTHQLCVTVVNAGLGSDLALGCRTVTGGTNDPFGAFDALTSPSAGTLVARGWAIDVDAGTGPVSMVVTVDGWPRTTVAAKGARPSLDTTYRRGPNHDFTATVTGVTRGSHQVCITATNVGRGANTSLGCRTVTVA